MQFGIMVNYTQSPISSKEKPYEQLEQLPVTALHTSQLSALQGLLGTETQE
jgi:hypothetical protein